jgi:acetoacetate decarboxylase
VADLPVHRIVGAHHFIADLTLPYGRVIYDYNTQNFIAPLGGDSPG